MHDLSIANIDVAWHAITFAIEASCRNIYNLCEGLRDQYLLYLCYHTHG